MSTPEYRAYYAVNKERLLADKRAWARAEYSKGAKKLFSEWNPSNARRS